MQLGHLINAFFYIAYSQHLDTHVFYPRQYQLTPFKQDK